MLKIVKLGLIVFVPIVATTTAVTVAVVAVKNKGGSELKDSPANTTKTSLDPLDSLGSLTFIGDKNEVNKITFLPLTLPINEGVEIKYGVSPKGDITEPTIYSAQIPTGLSIGDSVWVKAFCLPGYENSVSILSFPKMFEVRSVNYLNLVSVDFGEQNIDAPTFTGKDGYGTFSPIISSFGNGATVLKYAIADSKIDDSLIQDVNYEEVIPTNLMNGQFLYVKAFLRDESQSIFLKPQTPKIFRIDGLLNY